MEPFLRGHVRQPDGRPRGGARGQDRPRGGPGGGRRAPRGPTRRGRVHRRRHRGRQPGGEGRRPPARAAGDRRRRRHHRRSSTRGCSRRATGSPPRASGSRPVAARRNRASSTSTRSSPTLDDRTVVVSVMLVNNEVGTIQPLDAIVARRPRARAASAVVHTDAVQAVPWLDVARAAAGRRPGRDLGAQVRRPQGHRRAGRARRRRARAADRRRRPGRRAAFRHVERRRARSRWPRRCGPPTHRARRRRRRASGDCATVWSTACAPRSPTRSRTATGAPRSRATRTSASAASRPRRCSSRSTRRACARPPARRARRAPPIRRTCSRRWACGRDDALSSIRLSLGYASTDADVDVALDVVPTAVARLRPPAPRREQRARPRRDERRGRLLGRGRAPARAGVRRHRRDPQALGRRVRLRLLQRLRRRGRPARRRPARHPALRLQLHRRVRRRRRRRRTSRPTPPGARRTRAWSATASIKFGRLLERAEALGFDFLATGHHARVGAHRRRRVRTAPGRRSRQGPVLRALHARPARARAHAAPGRRAHQGRSARARCRLGLRTAEKPESMDVCFITRGGRETFLDRARSARAGAPSSTRTASLVGTHDGVATFTVGQRRGRRCRPRRTSLRRRRRRARAPPSPSVVVRTCCATSIDVRDLVFAGGRVRQSTAR